MSGIAAAIRCSHFGKSVLLLERHNAIGGLNSFYSQDGRKFDVGLHAMTNWVPPGTKGTPLAKILRQLRIRREELDLSPQTHSRICFPDAELKFTNDFGYFENQVIEAFPREREGFASLVAEIRAFNTNENWPRTVKARERLGAHLSDPLLIDMLLCPVMYYGSAETGDMDWGQFVVMFQALFLEGFCRPLDGIRILMRILRQKLKDAGVERCMKLGVKRLLASGSKVSALELDNGRSITADLILSSAGARETFDLVETGEGQARISEPAGLKRLGFAETITVTRKQPREFGFDDTITFFSTENRFTFDQPDELIDYRSGVVCMPNNFEYSEGRQMEEGFIRVTALASHEKWASLNGDVYRWEKAKAFRRMLKVAASLFPNADLKGVEKDTVATDMFTPLTVKRFTGHSGGAIYGSPVKYPDGRTPLENLILCGTDQGFLGITGAMMSGIMMANQHVISR